MEGLYEREDKELRWKGEEGRRRERRGGGDGEGGEMRGDGEERRWERRWGWEVRGGEGEGVGGERGR